LGFLEMVLARSERFVPEAAQSPAPTPRYRYKGGAVPSGSSLSIYFTKKTNIWRKTQF